MSYNLKYSRFNERSILIEWPSIIDKNVLESIINFKQQLKNKYSKQKVEVINTYNSILISYSFTIDNFNDEILTLKACFDATIVVENQPKRLWTIPVCYDPDFGPDLEDYAKAKQLSISEVIAQHASAIYTVYFIGFLPGFLYLGGLPKSLALDRKATPSLDIKKGAVAIGGQQTGIYPQNSPGGWHVIGNTPVPLFLPNEHPPSVFKAGDQLKFESISPEEYEQLSLAIKTSAYNLKSTIIDA